MIHHRLAFIVTASAAMQLASLNGAASAADLTSLKDTPPMSVTAPSWKGFYFGGHAGGVWSESKVTDTFTYIGDPTINSTLGSKGFIVGAQAGYNFQRGHFVFGPEADIGYLGISANKSFFQPGSAAACQTTYPGDQWATTYSADLCDVNGKYSVSSDLYGDLTARLGYEMDRTLLYVKGGGALLHANFKANYVGNNCTVRGPGCEEVGSNANNWDNPPVYYSTVPVYSVFNFNHSDILLGWTAGAGAEYALSPSWSIKAEYQHFDFGKMSYSYYGCYGFALASGSYPDPSYGKCPAGAPSTDNHYTSTLRGKTDVEITADAVKLGINYHLGN